MLLEGSIWIVIPNGMCQKLCAVPLDYESRRELGMRF